MGLGDKMRDAGRRAKALISAAVVACVGLLTYAGHAVYVATTELHLPAELRDFGHAVDEVISRSFGDEGLEQYRATIRTAACDAAISEAQGRGLPSVNDLAQGQVIGRLPVQYRIRAAEAARSAAGETVSRPERADLTVEAIAALACDEFLEA